MKKNIVAADRAGWLGRRRNFWMCLDGQRLIYTFCHDRTVGAVVQLIAATSGEGTSTLTRDLALIASRMPDMRVLLLDLDPPGNKQITAMREQYGVDAMEVDPVAAGTGGHVRPPPDLGQPARDGNPAGTPTRPRPGWGKMFDALRANFKLVLIDSPAIDRSYDGIMLASGCRYQPDRGGSGAHAVRGGAESTRPDIWMSAAPLAGWC